MDAQVESAIPCPQNFDAVVFAVAHEEYSKLNLIEWLFDSNICILDANNVLTKSQREDIKALPNAFAAIGRGDL